MRDTHIDSLLFLVAFGSTCLVILSMWKDRPSLSITYTIQEPSSVSSQSQQQRHHVELMWRRQEAALTKTITKLTNDDRALGLEVSPLAKTDKLTGRLVDFCPRCPVLALQFLRSGSEVAVVSPNRMHLKMVFGLIRAVNPVALDRTRLLWNRFSSASAKDDAIMQGDGATRPAVHLNNITTLFPRASVITLRFCLQQVDGFLFDSSDAFFTHFKVPVIVTQDAGEAKTSAQKVIAATLRLRNYSSVRAEFLKKGFRPFHPSGAAIEGSDWPAIVHWKRAS